MYDKAVLHIDLQGGCFDNAINRMKQKIIKSGKMNKAQITHYLKPYKERCIKPVSYTHLTLPTIYSV